MPAATRSLEAMVLQAHRAKGVRYPTSAQKDCFKTCAARARQATTRDEGSFPGRADVFVMSSCVGFRR
ncbi:hypothetical protein B5807_06941 [Epicoccum nigrum]|uniref:Uncharacterized protein n=1 Tax=Epicoccum nigrum TaxID=105696 RepID=A0A1Y2LY17_EPING|nr:hypothetical protein B5807_06941 [Epicoccum nigrum]